jgi:exosortase
LGTVLYVFSISGFSIFFLVIGLVLHLYGWEFTKINIAPLSFLLFMFPVPSELITRISFPLKMFVAKISTDIISMMSIPIYREGFNIIIPSGSLTVGNPCSGIRSIIAFMAIGYVFAYLSSSTIFRKLLLFSSSIPIAIVTNLIRVPFLILIAHFWGIKAAAPETIWHTGSGIVVFILGMVVIIYLGRLIECRK